MAEGTAAAAGLERMGGRSGSAIKAAPVSAERRKSLTAALSKRASGTIRKNKELASVLFQLVGKKF